MIHVSQAAFGATALSAGVLTVMLHLGGSEVKVKPPLSLSQEKGDDECGMHTELIFIRGKPGADVRTERQPSQPGQPAALQTQQPKTPAGEFRTRIVTDIPHTRSRIPEYNDCQRFIVPGKAANEWMYDAVYAIWAYENLQDYPADGAGDSIYQRASATTAALVAVIYSWGGTYRPLSLLPGFSCVYLWDRGRDGESRFEAKLLHNGDNERCEITVPANTDGPTVFRLTVVRRPVTKEMSDYPPVARWEWDARRNVQYMGVACAGWCSIGAEGLAPTLAPLQQPAEGVFGRVARGFGVQGWFDEQVLGVGTLVVSNVIGTLFPDTGLENRTDGDFKGHWVQVASVGLSTVPSHDPQPAARDLKAYRTKMGFSFAPIRRFMPLGSLLPGRLNTVSLCRGSVGDCRMRSDPCHNSWTWKESRPTTAEESWWARIVSAQGDTTFKCVNRRKHEGVNIPGSVRWRWLRNDETIWTPCVHGCCEVDS